MPAALGYTLVERSGSCYLAGEHRLPSSYNEIGEGFVIDDAVNYDCGCVLWALART